MLQTEKMDKNPKKIRSHIFDVKESEMGKAMDQAPSHGLNSPDEINNWANYHKKMGEKHYGEYLKLHPRDPNASAHHKLGSEHSTMAMYYKGKNKIGAIKPKREFKSKQLAATSNAVLSGKKIMGDKLLKRETSGGLSGHKVNLPTLKMPEPNFAKKSFQIMDDMMEMYKALPPKLTKPGKVKKQILAHGAHHTPPKEYRESGATEEKDYADIKNKKYPIHTEKHTRAAISYFSKPKNANVYSPQQQKAIWNRINNAALKYGITVGKKSGPPSVEKKIMKSIELIDGMIKSVDPQSGFRRNSNGHNGFMAALKHHSQGMGESAMKKQMHPDNHPKWNAGYQHGMNHLREQSAKTTKKKDSANWASAKQHKNVMNKFNNAANGHKYAAHMIAQRAHETAHEVPSDYAKNLAIKVSSEARNIGDRKSFYENAKLHHERQAAKHLEHATGKDVSPKGAQLHEEAMNRHLRASEKASRALKEPGRHLGYGAAAAHANDASVHAHKETHGMVEKSIELIDGMIKSAKSARLMPDPDKKSMEKGTEAEIKAYLGTLKPGEGFKPGSGSAPGGYHPGSPEKVKQKISDTDAKRMGWTTAKMEEQTGNKSMEKALKASDLPRIPKAIRMKMQEMHPYHSAMMRVSQANSRYQDKYQGPLQGEFLEDPTVSKAVDMDVVCESCGRTYLAKSDSGCPTCTTTKAMYCNKCGNPLQKSHGGALICSLCG